MSEAADTSKAAVSPADRSSSELQADIEKTRADLRATLDAIEFRLNVPKQARHAAHRVKSRVKRFQAANPVAFAAVVAGAAALVVTAGVLGYRSAARR
jgi:anti-sigma factor RsiW